MNSETASAIIACNEKITDLLNEYRQVSAVLLTLDNESAEEIGMLMHQRENIIDDIREIKAELLDSVNSLEPEEAAAVKQMYNREPFTRKLGAEMTEIQSSVLDLASAQGEAVKLDERLTAQFMTRNSEVREKLHSLQQDKKKINYYTKKVGAPKSGNYFDSIT